MELWELEEIRWRLADVETAVYYFLNTNDGFDWGTFGPNALAAAFGAGVGAGLGAWFMNRAERTRLLAERRRLLVEEIRNTNAAIALTSSIMNSFGQVKGQNTAPMFGKYTDDVNAREQFIAAKKVGHIPEIDEFNFELDLRNLLPIEPPFGTLQELIFANISLQGYPLMLLNFLSDSIKNFNNAIGEWNDIVVEFRANNYSHQQRANIYFSLTTAAGDTDERFPSIQMGLHTYNDDGLFFAKLLGLELGKHGQALADKFEREFKERPEINTIDFGNLEQRGLMPSDEAYADFHENVQGN